METRVVHRRNGHYKWTTKRRCPANRIRDILISEIKVAAMHRKSGRRSRVTKTTKQRVYITCWCHNCSDMKTGLRRRIDIERKLRNLEEFWKKIFVSCRCITFVVNKAHYITWYLLHCGTTLQHKIRVELEYTINNKKILLTISCNTFCCSKYLIDNNI